MPKRRAKLLLGRPVAQAILERARARAEVLAAQGVVPMLAILSCGTDLAAEAYLAGLASAAERTGVRLSPVALPQGTTQEAAQEALLALGRDHDVHGILLVHPLPPDWDEGKLNACLPPEKDVEGMNPANLGRVVLGEPRLAPCTAYGAFKLIQSTGVEFY
ncbi:MAG TPA: bifunctional 5,10-methylenetetrahydrofolate dehydrogenase/5,10-methenyltetrahydrofolate cyclohydrolase, partial [Candidatus Acetothermia bacterium]|nr:bifunctional 5,10-methylenetetrahydrofolate dehydrogenase/5,10-methenyltetrahydrofolate cyclohydrolase [Candidatus Acetothermia bacterium]